MNNNLRSHISLSPFLPLFHGHIPFKHTLHTSTLSIFITTAPSFSQNDK